MVMAEADFMRHLQKLATTAGARLFRQNTGMAWVGKIVRKGEGWITLADPRPFHAGVPGMSDLGGWTPVIITPDMVGKTVAVYTAVEVKVESRVSKEQSAFIAAVRSAGGKAGIARKDDDLTNILRLGPASAD
jgi:hypothetical protein